MLRRVLLADVPVTERRIMIGNASTMVLEAGDGLPVVLLHGGIEVGGIYWAPIIQALAQHHRVVVPDVPGVGESEPLPTPLDQNTFDAWFLALLEHTATEKPTLIVHSLVGTYAARFAARYGDRLHSLVLYGVPGIAAFRMPVGLMIAAILFDVWPSLTTQQRFLRWVFTDPARVRLRDPEWFDAFDAYSVDRGHVRHVKHTMRQLVKTGTQEVSAAELRRIPVPTQLLWGQDDRMTPLRLGHETSRAQGWPLRIVPDAGHAPHLEKPDAFLSAVQPFLPAQAEIAERVI